MKRSIYIIGLLLIAIASASSYILYKQMSEEKESAFSVKSDIDKASSEEIEVRREIKDVRQEKETLDAEIQSQSSKVQQLHEDVSSIQEQERAVSAELSEKESAFAGLKNMLDVITQKHSDLESELKNARSDYMTTADRTNTLRKQKQELEKGIKGYMTPPKGIELKKIVVKVAPPLEGEIVEINKEYSFAIINLGLNDNIKSGNIMAVYRKEEFIAKAVVENVYEDMSSVIVLDEWSDVALAPGDIVRLLKP